LKEVEIFQQVAESPPGEPYLLDIKVSKLNSQDHQLSHPPPHHVHNRELCYPFLDEAERA